MEALKALTAQEGKERERIEAENLSLKVIKTNMGDVVALLVYALFHIVHLLQGFRLKFNFVFFCFHTRGFDSSSSYCFVSVSSVAHPYLVAFNRF